MGVMNTVRRGFLVVALLICGACPAATPEEVEAWIKKEIPVGSSKDQVVSALEARGIEHSAGYKPELYYNKNKTISAAIRDTTKGVLVTGGVFMEFRFDANDKLRSFSVKEQFTGP